MQNDKCLFDWTFDIGGSVPTWLEVIAAHARLLAASDDDTNVYRVTELRQLHSAGNAD